jgi:hypothetical protein
VHTTAADAFIAERPRTAAPIAAIAKLLLNDVIMLLRF